MPEFFSSDGSFLLQFVVIFLVILVLLMGAALLFRRLAGRGLSVSARAGKSDRQPRLGIVDIYELDRQRQLILLRRDNVEHLLLVGGPNDVVVERNVQRGARLPSEGLLRPDIADDEAGRGLGGPGDEPSPREPALSPALAPTFAPTFDMPVVVPPLLPGSRSPTPVQAPSLDPRLFEPDETEADALAPSRPRTSRLLRRTPPPLVEPRPEPASEPPAGTPPIMVSGEPRPVDPAVLSDMAHQLEVALRRPASAVTPPPGVAPGHVPSHVPGLAPGSAEAAPSPATEPTEPPSRIPDPVAAGMAATQVLSPAIPAGGPQPRAASGEAPPAGAAPIRADHVASGAPGRAEPHPASAAKPSAPPAQPPGAKPAVEAEPVVEAKPKTPLAPVPTPKAAPPGAETLQSGTEPPPKAAAEAKPQSSPAPFSVEEIEAEFARLLGRPVDKKS